jgi:hypothetical protein
MKDITRLMASRSLLVSKGFRKERCSFLMPTGFEKAVMGSITAD